MEQKIFEFCDEDLMSSSFSAFQRMRTTGAFVDLTVVIGNRRFPIHRVVLAAAIPHITGMFPACSSEITVTDLDPEVFEDVLNFAYSGKIKIHDGKVRQLLRVSQILQLTKVHTACLKYTAMRINMSNVLDLRSLSVNIQSSRLIAICDFYILRNFEDLVHVQHKAFLELSFESLIEIISRDDLNVTKEERVFEAIIKWVKAFPEDRYSLFPEIFSGVRLTSIASDYLVDRISTEKLVVSSLQCKNLIEAAKNYHLSRRAFSSCEILNTRPRSASGHGLYAICCSSLGCFIEIYDSGNKVWIPLSQMVTKEFDHFVGSNGKIYIFKNSRNEIDTFDVKTLKTEHLGKYENPCNSDNPFQQVIVHNNEFYAFTSNKVLCYRAVGKRWIVKIFMDCNESGIASMGEHIYVTGGFIGGNLIATCKKYNPVTEVQSKISSMLSGRSCHCCAQLNSRLYVCHFHRGEIYNPIIDQWISIASMAHSERIISLSAYNGKLFALKEGQTEIYDPQQNSWTLDASVPSPCKFTKHVIVPFSL